MQLDQMLVFASVTATNYRGNRDTGFVAMAQYQVIALVDPLSTDIEITQFIVLVDINACIIYHHIGLVLGHSQKQDPAKGIKVFAGGCFPRQGQIDIGIRLTGREVFVAMHRKGDDIRIICQ